LISPFTGAAAEAAQEAAQQAERAARRLIASGGPRAVEQAGLTAVRAAIGVYRDGGSLTPVIGFAWLALVLTRLRVRGDAWARMDLEHHETHRRLWTDVVRRARPGYAAAPASLLALTAWQGDNGALANIALDHALADTPGYSMALLLRNALDAGAPPSMASPPMSPSQVAAAYDNPGDVPAEPDAPATEPADQPCRVRGPEQQARARAQPGRYRHKERSRSMTSNDPPLQRVRNLLAKPRPPGGLAGTEALIVKFTELMGPLWRRPGTPGRAAAQWRHG
jgi:uncharacterized protein DUF4192